MSILSETVDNYIANDDDMPYKLIYTHYGKGHQLMKLAEEATELADAVFKYGKNQSEDNLRHMIEELADVYVVGRQILISSDKEYFRKMIGEKIKRTIGRMENENNT